MTCDEPCRFIIDYIVLADEIARSFGKCDCSVTLAWDIYIISRRMFNPVIRIKSDAPSMQRGRRCQKMSNLIIRDQKNGPNTMFLLGSAVLLCRCGRRHDTPAEW